MYALFFVSSRLCGLVPQNCDFKDKPREKALQILCRVEDGTFVDALLDQAERRFEHRDSAFLLELVYGVLRNRSRLDWTLNRFSAQPVAKTDVRTRNILRLGAYQMLFLDRVPVSAAVNTAVELAKEHGNKERLRERTAQEPGPEAERGERSSDRDPVRRLSLLHSHPAWLVKRWVARFGADRTEELLRENNRPAPLMIRTNTLQHHAGRTQGRAGSRGSRGRADSQWSPLGLEIRSGPELRSLKAYQARLVHGPGRGRPADRPSCSSRGPARPSSMPVQRPAARPRIWRSHAEPGNGYRARKRSRPDRQDPGEQRAARDDALSGPCWATRSNTGRAASTRS